MGGRLKGPWTALAVACLIALAAAPAAQATFPGQNGKLAFERHSFSGNDSRTWTMNPDGSDLARLEDECNQVPVALPQWSPDGTKVLYVCWYDTLRIINADGTGDEFFYYNTDYIEALAWSPDARQIAFTGQWWNEDEGYHYYTVVWPAPGNSGGSTFLTDQATNWLDWSPDGRSIALAPFVSTINPDGTGLTPVTSGYQASWSPDNSKLAFQKVDATGWTQIYTIKPDGSGLAQVTTGATHKREPVWSPDGTKIAFTGTLDGQALPDVYTMNADGTNVIRVTSTPEVDGQSGLATHPHQRLPAPRGRLPHAGVAGAGLRALRARPTAPTARRLASGRATRPPGARPAHGRHPGLKRPGRQERRPPARHHGDRQPRHDRRRGRREGAGQHHRRAHALRPLRLHRRPAGPPQASRSPTRTTRPTPAGRAPPPSRSSPSRFRSRARPAPTRRSAPPASSTPPSRRWCPAR